MLGGSYVVTVRCHGAEQTVVLSDVDVVRAAAITIGRAFEIPALPGDEP
jgi:hypothetical protein